MFGANLCTQPQLPCNNQRFYPEVPSAQFDRTWPQSPAPWASCRGYHSLVRIVLALWYPNTACIPKIDDERMSIHLQKLTLNPTHGPHAVWTSSDGRSSSEGHLQVVLWVSWRYPLVSSNPGPSAHLQVTHFPAWHWAIRKLEQLAKAQVPPVKPQAAETAKTLPQRCRFCWEAEAKTFC